MKHPSKLPIDTLRSLFTTKFNRDHNLEKPGDAKQSKLKEFSIKVSEDIFKMIGGDQDSFQLMASGPRIVPLNAQMKLRPLLKELRNLNSSIDLSNYGLDREID